MNPIYNCSTRPDRVVSENFDGQLPGLESAVQEVNSPTSLRSRPSRPHAIVSPR